MKIILGLWFGLANNCILLIACALPLSVTAASVDHVLIINHGRLLASGRLDDLTRGNRTLEDVYLELTAGEAP